MPTTHAAVNHELQGSGKINAPRYPHDTSRVDDETQGWILTLARRGWSTARTARTVGVDWATAARCLDGWGVARNRRGERA